VSLLGLGRWAKRWAAANREMAAKLGLLGTAPKRPKRTPAKKKVAAKKEVAAKKKIVSKKKAATKSDLDIDYEEYLELYAEDNDGGKRPKLSKTKFSELSDEMMDLVNWENIERLPSAEKGRLRELEYLLIA